jgi:hypothetical protein
MVIQRLNLCERTFAMRWFCLFKVAIILCFINIFIPQNIVSALEIVGPDTLWTRTYGGVNNDEGHSVLQTSTGGYIIAGSFGGTVTSEGNMYFIWTDAYGDTLATDTYDGDKAYGVKTTSNGDYILVGSKPESGTRNDTTDVYLVKVEGGLSGSVEWTGTFGNKERDVGYSVDETTDGGYIICGVLGTLENSGQIYLIRTDTLGDSLWSKTFGKEYYDCGYSVNQTTDGGYIITGSIKTNDDVTDSGEVYVIKTDSLGDSLWARVFGGSESDVGYSVYQTVDGGYIITGYTASFSTLSNKEIYLIKLDSLGDSLWTRTYGDSLYHDIGFSVLQTSDGGYVICGGTTKTDSVDDPLDVYLLKTDSLGYLQWRKNYGGFNLDVGYSVYATADGGYIITGYTGSFGTGQKDVYAVKTKAMLNLISPSGGEAWQGGTYHTISWLPENQPDSSYRFRLLFSADGDSIYPDTLVQDISAATQSWEWIVPLIDSSRCYIKLELLDNSGRVVSEDICDGSFAIDITAPVIDSTTVWHDTSYCGPFEISTTVTDNCAGVDSVLLYYRRDQDPDWVAVLMGKVDQTDWYYDSIPPVSSPGDSVRYYIRASDWTEPSNNTTDPDSAPSTYYAFKAGAPGVSEHGVDLKVFSFGFQTNPVRGQAVFVLSMPIDGQVSLKIYDVTGRLVVMPANGMYSAGNYNIPLAQTLSAGVYFYVLDVGVLWRCEKGKFVIIR